MSSRPELGFAMPPEIPFRACPTCEGRGALFPDRTGRPAPCPRCQTAGRIKVAPPCASCGRAIDGQLEASYACALEPSWHCAECHFGDHNRPAPAEGEG